MNGVSLIFSCFKALTPTAFVVLIVLWLAAMLRIPGRPRRVLLAVGLCVFLLAGALFGGEWLLNQQELAWRQWVKGVFALLLWWAGCTVSVLTAYWIPRAVRDGNKVVGCWLRGITALCAVIAIGACTMLGALWVCTTAEEVTVYHGVKAVQEDSNWLDEYTVIYEYHTPFTRGDRPIGPIGG